MQRQPLVIGNWKMNGSKPLIARMAAVFAAHPELLQQVEVAICPPAVLLTSWCEATQALAIRAGVQDVNEHTDGAHTGEHSVQLMAEAGAAYVLLGHSERRQLYADTNTRVAAKLQQLLAYQTRPVRGVLCVGESASEREQEQTMTVIEAQLESALATLAVEQLGQLVIAYEPVWAIGTGLTASPAQAQQVHGFIRNWLVNKWGASGAAVQLLYGGSVKADNATALFAEADIDGGLIGGASLQAEEFLAICTAAQARSR
jgi:triosephosphate isomerase